MRLSDFIVANRTAILLEWERFVKTLRAGRRVDEVALRAHAEQILMTIAAEMRKPQTGEEQEAKSKGQGEGASAPAATRRSRTRDPVLPPDSSSTNSWRSFARCARASFGSG